MKSQFIEFANNQQAAAISGRQDAWLRRIEEQTGVKILPRGCQLTVSGEDDNVKQAEMALAHLRILEEAGVEITGMTVNYALACREKMDLSQAALLTKTFFITGRGRPVKAKSFGQWQYLQAIEKKDLVFAIGPAGTGKTFLAVLKAVEALKQKDKSKIILTRPAVEAGEKLGFLPGDLQEKVNPYLRPVYDALDEALGVESARKYVEKGVIEVAPLAYMRGRTLDDAFIILDEAQNTTCQQMKMFLTRMGAGSKAVITGDITQADLPPGQASGLIEAEQKLKDIPEIAFCYLSEVDVVRHPLVQKIIAAYRG
ncbi:MAG: PhoH family protein [Firmicutes bacterium]|nr:PhoH family protein [Bacillota bacterium]